MNPNTKTPEPAKTGKTSFFKSPTHLLLLLVIFALLVGTAIYVSKQNKEEPKTSTDVSAEVEQGQKTGSMTLNPSAKAVAESEILTVEVWADSGTEPVNAVQANISYPSDKFEFVNVDSAGSAFEIEAETTGSNGKVVIARGHVGKLTGKQLVAKINFKAKAGGEKVNISFDKDSSLLSALTNKNILGDTVDGNYQLEAGQ